MRSDPRAACCAPTGLQPTDTIPESIKAAEHQQCPCDPVHQREPDSHDFLFEKVDKPREQDKPGQGTEKDAGNEHQARDRMADDVFDSDDCKRSRKREARRDSSHKQGDGDESPRVARVAPSPPYPRAAGRARDIIPLLADDSANKARSVLFEGNEVRDERDPEAATILLTISQKAALTPITRPYRAPCSSVRRTQRMPTGPIGAASENPMTAPSRKYMRFMRLDRLTWSGLSSRVIHDRGREVQECGNCAQVREPGSDLLAVQQ